MAKTSEKKGTDKTGDKGTPAGSVLGGTEGAEGTVAEGDKGQGQSTSTSGDAGNDAELEVTLPDSVTVDEKLLGNFTTVAKEVGLDSEGATKVATMFAEHQKSATEAQAH